MSTNQSSGDSIDSAHETVPVELRGADSVEDASLSDVWVAGNPIGKLLHSCRETIDDLKTQQDELKAENQQLRERVASLEGRVTPDPTAKEYDEMSRDERVRAVRLSCARKAANNKGKASYDYNDVDTLLDHHPSTGYCFKLLKLAAGLDGFEYEKRSDGNDRLIVTLDDVKDESILHTVNKPNGGDSR